MSSYRHRVRYWSSMQDLVRRRWRAGRPYRTWRDSILRPAVLYCCRCGGWIDKRLSGNHPDGPTADHFPVPLSRWVPRGPHDVPDGAPAHRRCNLSAQNKMPGELPVTARLVPRVADRRW